MELRINVPQGLVVPLKAHLHPQTQGIRSAAQQQPFRHQFQHMEQMKIRLEPNSSFQRPWKHFRGLIEEAPSLPPNK